MPRFGDSTKNVNNEVMEKRRLIELSKDQLDKYEQELMAYPLEEGVPIAVYYKENVEKVDTPFIVVCRANTDRVYRKDDNLEIGSLYLYKLAKEKSGKIYFNITPYLSPILKRLKIPHDAELLIGGNFIDEKLAEVAGSVRLIEIDATAGMKRFSPDALGELDVDEIEEDIGISARTVEYEKIKNITGVSSESFKRFG